MEYQKVVVSGTLVEVYEYERRPPTRLWGQTPKRKKNRSKRPRGFNRRRWDNIIRLRRGFHRLVRANLGGDVHPAFVTLTFERDISTEDAFKCLAGFTRRSRACFGKAFEYIAVPEFQKRGTIHFHLLTWGIPQDVIKDERRNRTLQNLWLLGFVDCLATDGDSRLASYLAKYMSKAMLDDRLRNCRAYICTRGIMRSVSLPGSALSYIEEDYNIKFSTMQPLHQRTFSTQWLGEGRYTSYQLEK